MHAQGETDVKVKSEGSCFTCHVYIIMHIRYIGDELNDSSYKFRSIGLYVICPLSVSATSRCVHYIPR